MKLHIDDLLAILQKHPYFEKAKKVMEINAGHTEDSVYTHLIQTVDMARKSVNGNFITSPQAKTLFDNFMNKQVEEMQYKDIALIIALSHDIGKILSFKESRETFPMNIQKPNTESGNTYNPGHEYWGSKLIPDLLKELKLSPKIVEYIADVVRLHGQIFDFHTGFINFSIEEAIQDMKSRVEGYHREVLFNSYCDIAYNKPLQPCRELIVKMLSNPNTYRSRKYFVA